jgi:hypothetical protein
MLLQVLLWPYHAAVRAAATLPCGCWHCCKHCCGPYHTAAAPVVLLLYCCRCCCDVALLLHVLLYSCCTAAGAAAPTVALLPARRLRPLQALAAAAAVAASAAAQLPRSRACSMPCSASAVGQLLLCCSLKQALLPPLLLQQIRLSWHAEGPAACPAAPPPAVLLWGGQLRLSAGSCP